MIPVIAVTGRRLRAGRIAGLADFVAKHSVDVHFSSYVRSIAAAGGSPLQVIPETGVDAIVRLADGIVLCGGGDVDPRRYAPELVGHAEDVDAARDDFEADLLKAAYRRGLPVLGICRGLQLINVSFGGTLLGDVERTTGTNHLHTHARPDDRTHEVILELDSVLGQTLGPTVNVNSFHHQAIDQPGPAVRVTGRSVDGIVEAIEVDGAPIVGVQWHPEMLAPTDPVFTWLVDAARAFAAKDPNESTTMQGVAHAR